MSFKMPFVLFDDEGPFLVLKLAPTATVAAGPVVARRMLIRWMLAEQEERSILDGMRMQVRRELAEAFQRETIRKQREREDFDQARVEGQHTAMIAVLLAEF